MEFRAILENDVYQPGSGGTGETTGETVEGQREEYASAPPMPDVEMEDGGQPEEDNLESTDPNHEIHVAPRERAINSLVNLVDGTLEIYDRVLAFCVVCRDPRHTLAECTFAEGMVAEVNRGVEIMREAIFRYPKHRRPRDMSTSSDPPQQSRENTGSMDVDGAESADSSGKATQSQSRTSPWRRNYCKRLDPHPV